MVAVTLGTLALRLIAPAAARPAALQLRARAETVFVPALLQALGERLEQVYGRDAVIRIRSLRLRFAMPPSGLDAAQWIDALSADLAEQIQQTIGRERGHGGRPAVAASTRVYQDRAHECACALAEATDEGVRTGEDRSAFEAVWSMLTASPPRLLFDALARCHELGVLSAVLAALTDAQAHDLAQMAVAEAAGPVPDAIAVRRARGASSVDGMAADHAAALAGGRASDMPAVAVPSAATTEDSLEAPPARAASDSGADAGGIAGPPAAVDAGDDATASTPAQPFAARAAAGRTTRDGSLAVPVAPRRAAAGRGPTNGVRAHAGEVVPPAVGASDRTAPAAVDRQASRWCALLYLVNVSLRLELPERLWQTGIDEGACLSAMMARLCRDADDPVTTVLARTHPHPPPPLGVVPSWAREEIVAGLWAAVDQWPALGGGAPALRAAVGTRAARIAPAREVDLPSWLGALHLAIADRLLGGESVPDERALRWGTSGVIDVGPQLIRVVQPMAAIAIDMRRAGLDRDPGRLPWLDKRLLFVFDDDAAGHG